MPRPKLIRSADFSYHVVVRTNNKEWFQIPLLNTWEILCRCLSVSAHRFGAIPYALVVMSNHFHLLVRTPNMNLDKLMQHFQLRATLAFQKASGRINHIYGNRYKASILDTPYAHAYVYKYILRNPVRAGICRRVEDYAYSTFKDVSILPVSDGIDRYWSQIPKNPRERTLWLNKPVAAEREALVARAMRRSRFAFSTNSNLQKELRILSTEYLHDSA